MLPPPNGQPASEVPYRFTPSRTDDELGRERPPPDDSDATRAATELPAKTEAEAAHSVADDELGEVRSPSDGLLASERPRRPTPSPADDGITFGATRSVSLVSTYRRILARTPTELLLTRDASDTMLLRTALVSAMRAGTPALDDWSNMIRPHEINLHDTLTVSFPTSVIQRFFR